MGKKYKISSIPMVILPDSGDNEKTDQEIYLINHKMARKLILAGAKYEPFYYSVSETSDE